MNLTKDDKVSIIMPSYNTGDYIKLSVESVLKQTYKNWELIIVDDCSTDNTAEYLTSLKDSRITVIKNPMKMGAAYSRNVAINIASGRWIAFLDSDDLWMPHKLEKQMFFMKNNEYRFSYTNYEEIDECGHKKERYVTGPKTVNEKDMLNYDWIGCLTVMYDAKYLKMEPFIKIERLCDYAMWLKIIKQADCYLLEEYLAVYRRGRKGSLSNRNYIELIAWHYKLFREVEQFSVLKSVEYTIRNIIFGTYKKLKYVKRKTM